MTTLHTVSQAERPTPGVGDLRPIPGCPGYFVSADGRVFSKVRRMFAPGGMREMAVIGGKVRFRAGTVRMVKRSVRGLVREAYGR